MVVNRLCCIPPLRQVLNVRCVFGIRLAFCPCLKKKDSCLEILAGWLPDDVGASPSSLASAYKKASSAVRSVDNQPQTGAVVPSAAPESK